MIVWINLVVNSVLFQFRVKPETSLDLSKTWVDDNIQSSISILYTKKLITNNYRMAQGHIRPQSDDEQGVSKLQPNVQPQVH